MLIGTDVVKGQGPVERIVDPKSGTAIQELASASDNQVSAAIAAARAAFDMWSRTTPGERSAFLLKIADAIEAEGDALAQLEARNTGKPRHLVVRDEIPATVDCFRFFAGAARTMTSAAAGEYIADHTSMIRRDPIGVVASIAPWNYPLMMAAWKLAPGGLGGTFAGNPLAVAAAHAVLDVIADEDLLVRSTELGDRLKARLARLANRVPHISDVRGPGAMIAVEFTDPITGKPDAGFARETQRRALEGGLLTLTCGTYGNVMRFLFPLTISDETLEEGIAILEDALV